MIIHVLMLAISNLRYTLRPFIVLLILLLTRELYKGGEHASNLLVVSVSVSIGITIQTVRKQGARRDFIDTLILMW